ncbi:MAG: acyl-CoA thioesterase [Microthrixaceae bacterium]
MTDADFLGLVRDDEPGGFRFSVVNHLSRLDGRLYGGTAIAVSIVVAEQISERAPLWMTTQFVSTAPGGADVSVLGEILAPGRRTNQVRVTATDDSGAVMFASLGATGHHRPGGLAGTFEHAPEVAAPDDSADSGGPFVAMLRNAGVAEPPRVPQGVGFASVVEFREPEIRSHPDGGPGRICMWCRRRDGVALTPAMLSFVADMVPLSVAHGAGLVAGGVSLDNTIRFAAAEPTEWVLLDLRAHFAAGAYGHGVAHLWSESGALLATASQTASMFEFDGSTSPWARRG